MIHDRLYYWSRVVQVPLVTVISLGKIPCRLWMSQGACQQYLIIFNRPTVTMSAFPGNGHGNACKRTGTADELKPLHDFVELRRATLERISESLKKSLGQESGPESTRDDLLSSSLHDARVMSMEICAQLDSAVHSEVECDLQLNEGLS